MINHTLTHRQNKAVNKYFSEFLEKYGNKIITTEQNGIIRVFFHDRFNAKVNIKNIIGIPIVLTFDNESDYNRFILKVGKR